jgi:hypothetical protein
MMQTASEPSQQAIVDSIVKEMITAGRPLYETDSRNELALRYYAKDIEALKEKIYSDKTFCDKMNKLIAIEYAGRYGREMLKANEHNPAIINLDSITPELYRMMTRDQRTVVDVLRDAQKKNIPLKDYVNSHGYHLRCWQNQSPEFDAFMKEHEEISWEIVSLAKPESVTRFTRFNRADVEAKYGAPKKPTLAMFPSQES